MTSIAEKYAQQYQPNGEVSLADLIQAAVDEVQSVPAVGDVVAWRWFDSMNELVLSHLNPLKLGINASVLEPLIIRPIHSIPAAELATLRENLAKAEQERDLAKELLETSMLGFENLSKAYAASIADRDELRKDAERYRWLQKQSSYLLKKLQQASITDSGDVTYFHADKFDTAIDAAIAQGKGE